MTGKLLLNVGSGPHPAPKPWVNIDAVAERGPDIVGSVLDLPYNDSSAEAIYAGHVLEHLSWPDEVDAALVEFLRVLRPGGRLMVVGPDMDRAEKIGDEELICSIVTGPEGDHPGDNHKWTCREQMIVDAVQGVFGRCEAVAIGNVSDFWPVVSRIGWQCAVAAVKA